MRNLPCANQLVTIREIHHLHRPTGLELKGSRASLAPSKIEHTVAFPTTLLNQLPVHKIVWRIAVELRQCTAIIRKHLIAEIEAHHAGDRLPTPSHPENTALLREFPLKSGKQLLREHGCSQVMNASRIYLVELV